MTITPGRSRRHERARSGLVLEHAEQILAVRARLHARARAAPDRPRRCSPCGTRSLRGTRPSGPAAPRWPGCSSTPASATRACRCRATRCRARASRRGAAPRSRYARLTSVISSSPRARRLQRRRDVDHLVVVEVQPGDRVGRLRLRRLLLEADGAAGRVELDDAVALGIANLVAEHRRAGLAGRGAAQVVGEVRAVEDVVAERERDAIGADELAADEERLREAVGARLRGVLDLQAELRAVAEQAPEAVLLVRRRDDEDRRGCPPASASTAGSTPSACCRSAPAAC